MDEWENILVDMKADNLPLAHRARIASNYFREVVGPDMQADSLPPERQAKIKANFFNTLAEPPEPVSKMPTLSAYGIGEGTAPASGDAEPSKIFPGVSVPRQSKTVMAKTPFTQQPSTLPELPFNKTMRIVGEKIDLDKQADILKQRSERVGIVRKALKSSPRRTAQDVQSFNATVQQLNNDIETFLSETEVFNIAINKERPPAPKTSPLPLHEITPLGATSGISTITGKPFELPGKTLIPLRSAL